MDGKRNGPEYFNKKQAALFINETLKKRPLLGFPSSETFPLESMMGIRTLIMVLQVEEIVEFPVLYPDFEFLIFFDHSTGHGRKRVAGCKSHVKSILRYMTARDSSSQVSSIEQRYSSFQAPWLA